jgi:hypothetical protein
VVVVVRKRLARVGIVANARRPVPAERRADDAHVEVLDRIEIGLAHGARAGRASVADHLARHRVDAGRVDQTADEIGHRLCEDRLLVGHRRRIVDHEQEIDLRYFVLFRRR